MKKMFLLVLLTSFCWIQAANADAHQVKSKAKLTVTANASHFVYSPFVEDDIIRTNANGQCGKSIYWRCIKTNDFGFRAYCQYTSGSHSKVFYVVFWERHITYTSTRRVVVAQRWYHEVFGENFWRENNSSTRPAYRC